MRGDWTSGTNRENAGALISYKARRRGEGKKLTWRDGVEALWILTRVRLRSGRQRAASLASM
jgi:hypothetical protein